MKKEIVLWVALVTTVVAILTTSTVIVSGENRQMKDIVKADVAPVENTYTEESNEPTIPQSITGLLIGFDVSKELTDVLMVAHLNTETNELDIISVPRDLLIDFSDDLFAEIKANNPDNNIDFCKLNEVYSHVGGGQRGISDLKAIISIITGIEIDHVATINTNTFVDLVDIVGGVEFDVPERMYHIDKAQDLYIDLQPGLQHLDGEKAEQLVRYRSYKMGDLQRIKVQQEFVLTVFKKVMQIGEFSKIKEMATLGYTMIDADFGLAKALEYAKYLFELKLDNVMNSDHMITLPNYGEKIGDIWYQTWDVEECRTVVKDLIGY